MLNVTVFGFVMFDTPVFFGAFHSMVRLVRDQRLRLGYALSRVATQRKKGSLENHAKPVTRKLADSAELRDACVVILLSVLLLG